MNCIEHQTKIAWREGGMKVALANNPRVMQGTFIRLMKCNLHRFKEGVVRLALVGRVHQKGGRVALHQTIN